MFAIRFAAPCRATARAWRLAVAAISLLGLAACGSLPQNVERQVSQAPGAALDTPLGRIAKASTADPEQSGFRLMPTGQFALQARIELGRRAQRTLDVQYYQIFDDRTGRYLCWASTSTPMSRCGCSTPSRSVGRTS
jgi:putative cardiolipin synthase